MLILATLLIMKQFVLDEELTLFSAHAKFDILTGVCHLVETESVHYKSVNLLNRLLPQDL